MRGERITAREGYVYTDGKYFGATVYLRQGDDGSGWHEVPVEEIDQLEEASAADYEAALERFGVEV